MAENTAKPSDTIIIGAGISALITALDLCEAGQNVTIYERRGREEYGGQCNWAFGGFFFADSPQQRRFGVKDSHELAWEDWQSYAEFGPGSHHQQAWAQRYIEQSVPEVHDWITSRGMSFFPTPNWAERAAHGKGNRVPRFHLLWGCGPELSANIIASLNRHEGRRLQLRFNHHVTDLTTAGGKVTGISGTDGNGQPFSDSAPTTVIAAGGFTGNLDEVRANWPAEWHKAPQELLTGVWPEMDGLLHHRAQAIGAALVNMENMWVYAAGVKAWRENIPDQGNAIIPLKSALWMQANGRRFNPPLLAGYDTREAVQRISAQENPWTWMIASRSILDQELTIQGSDFNPGFREKSYLQVARDVFGSNHSLSQEFIDSCPDVVTASNLEILGQKMAALNNGVAIDESGMAADIATYDQQISLGGKLYTDEQLVSLRSVRAFLSDKLRTANYEAVNSGELVAIRLRLTARKSLGGILTDQNCQVLDEAENPITGLYAIGEATGFGGGGMNGKRTLEGTLLGGCVLTARALSAHLLEI